MSELQGKDSTNNADANTDSTQKTFPKKFVFIADNSTEERKKARMHAVREHHRRRKWQDVHAPNPRTQIQFSWRRKEGYPATSEDPVDATEALAPQPDSPKQTPGPPNVVSASPRSRRSKKGPQKHGKKNRHVHAMSTLAAQGVHPARSPVPPDQEDRMERGAAESSSALSVRPATLSPVHMLRRGNSDPFNATALRVTATVNELMRYSREYYVNSMWPAEDSLDGQSSAVMVWKEDMKTAIADATNFHAALALASLYKANAHRNSPASPNLLLHGLRHKVSGLASVRQCLQNDASDLSVLPAILALGGAEFYAGNHEATVLHLKAARHITNATGGLARLQENVRNLIGIADTVTSWWLLRRTVFPVEDWDPGPWNKQSLSQQYHLHTMPIWAIHVEVPNVFLKNILAELNQLVSVRRLALSLDNRKHRNEIFKWLHLRRSSIKVYLLHHYLDIVDSAQTPASSPEDVDHGLAIALCFASWYLYGIIVYPIATIVMHFPLQRLQNAVGTVLQRSEATDYTSRPNLVLWIYFVAAIAEELSEEDVSGDKKRPFTFRFLGIAHKLGLASWQETRDILRLFLYDQVLDKYLKALFARLDPVYLYPEAVRI